jgi:hypothetical protein
MDGWYDAAGALQTTLTPQPIGVLWSSVTTVPDVSIAEGLGHALRRLICRDCETGVHFKTRQVTFSSAGVPTFADLAASGTGGSAGADSAYFTAIASFHQHLWGVGYGVGNTAGYTSFRPELARFSQPSFSPFQTADSIVIGDRVRALRERAVMLAVAGNALFLGASKALFRGDGLRPGLVDRGNAGREVRPDRTEGRCGGWLDLLLLDLERLGALHRWRSTAVPVRCDRGRGVHRGQRIQGDRHLRQAHVPGAGALRQRVWCPYALRVRCAAGRLCLHRRGHRTGGELRRVGGADLPEHRGWSERAGGSGDCRDVLDHLERRALSMDRRRHRRAARNQHQAAGCGLVDSPAADECRGRLVHADRAPRLGHGYEWRIRSLKNGVYGSYVGPMVQSQFTTLAADGSSGGPHDLRPGQSTVS